MPYVPQTSTQNRIASASAVVLIEGLMLLMLAKGLTMVVNRIEPDRNLRNTNYPAPKPIDPVPEPSARPEHVQTVTRPVDQQLIDLPLGPVDLGPLKVPVDPTAGSGGTVVVPRRAALPAQGPRPLGGSAQWASADDYPPYDLRLGHQGTTRYRLEVGANGQVRGCQVTGSSGWPGLDAATCRLISARARFAPASDDTGAAVAGSYSGGVTWRIPVE